MGILESVGGISIESASWLGPSSGRREEEEEEEEGEEKDQAVNTPSPPNPMFPPAPTPIHGMDPSPGAMVASQVNGAGGDQVMNGAIPDIEGHQATGEQGSSEHGSGEQGSGEQGSGEQGLSNPQAPKANANQQPARKSARLVQQPVQTVSPYTGISTAPASKKQTRHSKTKGKLQGGAKLLSKPKPRPDGHAGVYEIVDLTILPEIIKDLTVYGGKTFTTDNNKGMQKILPQNVALLYGLDRDISYIYTPRFHDEEALAFFQAVLKVVESDYDEHGIPLHLQGDNSSSTFQILTHKSFAPKILW
ncbi:hypothetical protein L208DRAFT_1379900 [Tricholoma matsutake]|nr:hypothetical protein L208DRAFT_1379900 [Tricholoma matsutake 945]